MTGQLLRQRARMFFGAKIQSYTDVMAVYVWLTFHIHIHYIGIGSNL